MVFFVAMCAVMFYLLNIPLCASARLKADEKINLRVRISAFSYGFPIRKNIPLNAETFSSANAHRNSIKSAMAGWNYLNRHITGVRISGHIMLGTGDAAQTAYICGLLAALAAITNTASANGINIKTEPDFERARLRGEIKGIVRIKVGHIMGAILISIIRRIQAWKSIPLRAS